MAGMELGFLGLAEHATLVRDGLTPLFKWQILGLKQIVVSPLFPLRLNGLYFGIALKREMTGKDITIRVLNTLDVEIGKISLSTITVSNTQVASDASEDPSTLERGIPESPILRVSDSGWTIAFLPLGNTMLSIPKPGLYRLHAQCDGEEFEIGQVGAALLDPPLLTPELIAAIKSDPRAAKVVRITLACQKCDSKMIVYAGLERSATQEKSGAIWYTDCPDYFVCGCGASSQDLSSIRRNLFAYLGSHVGPGEEVSAVPMYHRTGVLDTRLSFLQLLERATNEETIQKFVEAHPILLHQFPARRIFWKPPLLSKYKADVGLLLPSRELLLIEFERSTLRILKKDGGIAAQLQHAFDQVDSWLEIADEHRLAILANLNISPDSVGAVRGLVIAGRDKGNDAAHLRRLKSSDRGKVRFLTYDDLLEGLAVLASNMPGAST